MIFPGRKFLFAILIYSSFLVSKVALAHDFASLKSVMDIVHERFPLILGAEQEIRRAEGERRSALGEFDIKWKSKASFIPEGYYKTSRVDSVIEKPTSAWGMNFYGGYRQGDNGFAVYDEKYETLPAGELRAGVEIPLLRNREIDERRAGLRLADLGIDLAGLEFDSKRIDVTLKASAKYWYWVAAGNKKRIVSELLTLAKERLRGIEERVRQGDLPEFELKDNNRNILQRENQLVKANRSFQNASIELGVFIGRDNELISENVNFQFMPSLGPKDLMSKDEYVKFALSKRPEIKSLNIIRDQINTELKLYNNQVDPKLNFMFEVSKDLGEGNKTKEPTEVESGLLLEIPLQVRKAEGKIQSLESKLKKIDYELTYFRTRVDADIRDALSALENAREQVRIIRSELKYAKELEAGERTRFSAGESTIFVVNLREQATADTAIKEVEALADYHIAEASLKAALGEW